MTSCLANSNNIGSSKNLEILTSSDRPWNVCVCGGGGGGGGACTCVCVCGYACTRVCGGVHACACVGMLGDYSPPGKGSLH